MSKKRKHFKFRTVGVAMVKDHVLIHQYIESSFWSLPGGHIEFQEDSRTGLQREFVEETGHSISILRPLWITENFYKPSPEKKFHEIAFYYLIELKNHKMENFNGFEKDKLLRFEWVPVSSLPKYHLEPNFLTEALQNPLPKHIQHLVIRKNSISGTA
ncbi:MAG: NUDIX domain-containing protein [Anaerolineaceae bacterium]|nr:NUDIX domain-containing protein [Anaerolineaceae bacterium]